jgi:hypothetical protein
MGRVVTEPVVAPVRLLVVRGISSADPDYLATDSLGDARRVVENNGRCDHKVERSVWKRQLLTARQKQSNSVSIAQVPARSGELGSTEVDAYKRNIELVTKFAKQFPIPTADFEH